VIKGLIKKLNKVFKGEKGFTLIELLVVVAILGVLAMVVVPNVASFMGRGNATAVQANVASIQTAIDAYAADHSGAYPTSTSQLTTPTQYIRNLPTIGSYSVTIGTVTGFNDGGTGTITWH
jgi:prepilin-type N-terminal cleavage/methylation domain-containing protein